MMVVVVVVVRLVISICTAIRVQRVYSVYHRVGVVGVGGEINNLRAAHNTKPHQHQEKKGALFANFCVKVSL